MNVTNADAVGNNSGHAVDPNKASGSSPPDIGQLQVGEQYELTADFTPTPLKGRRKKFGPIEFKKGTRFVARGKSKPDILVTVVGPTSGVWLHDDDACLLLPLLRPIEQDGLSVLASLPSDVEAEAVVVQLIVNGKEARTD